ncbi:MAG: WD40 repeat domain-containing protein, partial [Actinomycetota bacterium]
ATGRPVHVIEAHPSWVRGCVLSADGSFGVSWSQHELCAWSTATGRELSRFGHRRDVWGCALSPDGSFAVSAGEDRAVRMWDPHSGEELRALHGHTAPVATCAVTADGARIVSADRDGWLVVWEAASGVEEMALPLLGPASAVALHPSRPLIVCGDAAGNVYVLDLMEADRGPARPTHAGAVRE